MKKNQYLHIEKFWLLFSGGNVEKFPRFIEAFIYASFLTGMVLSFPSLLDNPIIFLATFSFTYWLILRFIPVVCKNHTFQITRDEYVYVYLIMASLMLLLIFSLFTAPISSDGQRIKLARMLMNVHSGSAWDVSRVDSLSTMYLFPSAYYLIFTYIEALYLPKITYGLFNASLIVASYLTFLQMVKHQRPIFLLCALVFFMSPQIIFAALSEQEEALTFFLALRSVYWLTSGVPPISIVIAGLAGILAIATKYSVATFFPITVLVLLGYFSSREHISQIFSLRHLFPVTIALTLITCIIFLPDVLVSEATGKDFLEKISLLSKYHLSNDTSCWIPHLKLRFFEMLVDYPNALLSLSGISISHLLPKHSFLTDLCSSESTLLTSYIHSDKLSRTSVQYGIVPFVAALSVFVSKGRQRLLAVFSIVAFVGMIFLFTFRFKYWVGTGRYFIVPYMALMPAFLICMEALRSRLSRKCFNFILLMIAVPSLTLFVRSEIDVQSAAKNFLKGDYYTRQAFKLTNGLLPLTGPANVYFNDVMSFHSILSIIPSRDVTLHKALVADRTNIVAVPTVYDGRTNWHEMNWMLPIPDVLGQYVFIGNVGNFYGNTVPSRFFRGLLPDEQISTERFRLVYVSPTDAPEAWQTYVPDLKVASLENKKNGAYFVSSKNSSMLGICLFKSSNLISWYVSNSKCEDEP